LGLEQHLERDRRVGCDRYGWRFDRELDALLEAVTLLEPPASLTHATLFEELPHLLATEACKTAQHCLVRTVTGQLWTDLEP
jgi:hypothetical protein